MPVYERGALPFLPDKPMALALALALALAWREPCLESHPLRVRSIGVLAGVNNFSPRYRSLSTVRP